MRLDQLELAALSQGLMQSGEDMVISEARLEGRSKVLIWGIVARRPSTAQFQSALVVQFCRSCAPMLPVASPRAVSRLGTPPAGYSLSVVRSG